MITPKWYCVSVAELVSNMKTLGPDHIVLSSDLGQIHNPLPAEGLRGYIQILLEEGIPPDDIEKMFRHNTSSLLYGEE